MVRKPGLAMPGITEFQLTFLPFTEVYLSPIASLRSLAGGGHKAHVHSI